MLNFLHFFLCRYDPGKKTLKNMKPLPDSILQSLDGDLDILGPYPPSY